jgi:hypothetical protein
MHVVRIVCLDENVIAQGRFRQSPVAARRSDSLVGPSRLADLNAVLKRMHEYRPWSASHDRDSYIIVFAGPDCASNFVECHASLL